MNELSSLNLENNRRQGEDYFFGCLGAVALIIGAVEWILRGCSLSWLPHWLGCGLAWLAMTSLQSLTVVSLRCRLVFLRLSKSWFWLLLILWVAFDIPLVVSREALRRVLISQPRAQASILLVIFQQDFPRQGGTGLICCLWRQYFSLHRHYAPSGASRLRCWYRFTSAKPAQR
jgi:hypothetical protein